jgi:hypothetical protein
VKLKALFVIIIASMAAAQATQNTGVMLSPLHSEFGRRARGEFTLTNQGYSTLNVSLDVVSIQIKSGQAVISPGLDSGVRVKLSQYSAKIGAKQAHVFYYSVSCDSYPCSVAIASNIAQGHTDAGEAVVLRMLEIAYLCEKQKGCRDSIISAESAGDLKAKN